jgi:hypothetical protein
VFVFVFFFFFFFGPGSAKWSPTGKHEFSIEVATPHYRRKFAAATSEECKEWIKAINLHCINSVDQFPFQSTLPLHEVNRTRTHRTRTHRTRTTARTHRTRTHTTALALTRAMVGRQKINARWLVDGKDTFKEMARAIRNAKESIFIADWFFSPEIYLIRENEITGSSPPRTTRTAHTARHTPHTTHAHAHAHVQ